MITPGGGLASFGAYSPIKVALCDLQNPTEVFAGVLVTKTEYPGKNGGIYV